MPIQNPQKTVSPEAIACNDTADVLISFEASAALCTEPADIVLLIDRSTSMWPPKLENAQAAANDLIDMLASASGGTDTLENGSRIGIVSFAGNAKRFWIFPQTPQLFMKRSTLSCSEAVPIISGPLSLLK